MRGKLHGFCILIAEDEYLLAGILAELVSLNGGTVVGPVASEEDGWTILDRLKIDGAVLDVRLEDGSCFPLAEALLRRRVPVIFTTGHSVSEIPEKFRDLPTFTKPSKFEQLVDCIADCCRVGPEEALPVPKSSFDGGRRRDPRLAGRASASPLAVADGRLGKRPLRSPVGVATRRIEARDG